MNRTLSRLLSFALVALSLTSIIGSVAARTAIGGLAWMLFALVAVFAAVVGALAWDDSKTFQKKQGFALSKPITRRKGKAALLIFACVGMAVLLSVTTTRVGGLVIVPSPLWVTAFIVIGLCLAWGIRWVHQRPRTMTAQEHRYFYGHRDEKPEYLSWPGTPVVTPRFIPWSESWLRSCYERRPALTVSVAAAITMLLVAGSSLAMATPALADEGEVVKVIDGDTLDVRVNGTVVRVRVLNINTPELRTDGGAECMADEAKFKMEELAPVGASVVLQYGPERSDRYGRTLAAVRDTNGRLLSEAIALQGLGSAISIGENSLTYEEVRKAEEAARAAGVGLFGKTVDCTPAAVLASLESEAALGSALPAGSADLAVISAQLEAVMTSAESRMAAVLAANWVTDSIRQQYESEVSALLGLVKSRQRQVDGGITVAKHKEEAAVAAQAAADEAARVAAEAERAAADEAARQAAEQAAREEEAEQAAQEEADSSGSSDGGSESDSGGGYPSDAGYTGCRNYNGYGMVDSKGRHFEPIPCP